MVFGGVELNDAVVVDKALELLHIAELATPILRIITGGARSLRARGGLVCRWWSISSPLRLPSSRDCFTRRAVIVIISLLKRWDLDKHRCWPAPDTTWSPRGRLLFGHWHLQAFQPLLLMVSQICSLQ